MKKLLLMVSSQVKLLPHTAEEELLSRKINSTTMLKNDTFSFQVLLRCPDELRWQPLSIKVNSKNLPISVYRVGYVAVSNAANDKNQKGYVGNTPGLYPNPLYERNCNPEVSRISKDFFEEEGEENLICSDGSFSSLWVTVNADRKELEAGKNSIGISLYSLTSGELLEEESFEIDVIDKSLCDKELFYTNWFHVDCLCDYYGTQPYDERFYSLFRTFVTNMVRHRQNTIIAPAITPAFDTPVGQERRNVQLVEITKENGEYKFNFEKLKKYVDTCLECGIKYFELPPLFCQWGAEFAVNIYLKDGTKLFGWETEATSPEYTEFLHRYIKALFEFEKENGYDGRFIFHISDEPTKENKPSYKKAADTVSALLEGRTVIDALDDIDIYKEGIAKTPVAFMTKAEIFAKECDDFWLYYTGGIADIEITNRLITNTAARTRVLGLQLWYYGAKGFLHWGYNYCYNYLSRGFYDPISEPCGYKNYPGCSYLAYYTPKGAIPSVCEKLMGEAFDDVSALYTLEGMIGRDAVCRLCEDILGKKISNELVPEGDKLYELRLSVNEAIKKYGVNC